MGTWVLAGASQINAHSSSCLHVERRWAHHVFFTLRRRSSFSIGPPRSSAVQPTSAIVMARRAIRSMGNAADAVDAAMNRAAESAAARVEALGAAAQHALHRRCRWAGGALMGLAQLCGALIKGPADLAAALLAAPLRIVCGLLGHRIALLRGLLQPGSALAGGTLVAAGLLVAFVQRLVGAQAADRPLTPAESALLRTVFGDALALGGIRIVAGRAGLFGLSARPFALGNAIYLKRRGTADGALLVHEAVHVWQYRRCGPRYAAEALAAQAVHGRAAYDWTLEPARGRTRWLRFNREAQAQLIEDLWRSGACSATGADAGASRFVHRGIDRTVLARAALAVLRRRP